MNTSTVTNSYKVWFTGNGDYQPGKVARLNHSYAGHPLLTLAALEKLAHRLYEAKTGQVKFIAKGTQLNSDFNTLNQNQVDVSIAEVFKNMPNPGSWIALYAVQTDPEYKKLLWEIVNSVEPDWHVKDPGLFFVDGYIFISSAPSVTPFHIDRENNFLLQLAGKKTFGVWHPDDRAAVSDEAVENWIVNSSLSKVKYDESFLKHAAVHDVLAAGDGIYMPSTAPHMTYAGAELTSADSPYSITMGVVFYTQRTKKLAYIYALNNFLRKLGVQPAAPGANKLRDAMKYVLGRAFVFIRKTQRGYKPPTGF